MPFRYACSDANARKERTMLVVDGEGIHARTARLGPCGTRLDPLPNSPLFRGFAALAAPPHGRPGTADGRRPTRPAPVQRGWRRASLLAALGRALLTLEHRFHPEESPS